MTTMLTPLPDGFEPTRSTLHAYALAASVIPRSHAEPHDKWWHVALDVVTQDELSRAWVTDLVQLPEGGELVLRFDFHDHVLVLDTGDDRTSSLPLDGGLTGTEFGERLIAAVGDLGLTGDYARDKFESDEPRTYDSTVAREFSAILAAVAQVFKEHRATLEGDVGKVNLWPHGFDLAMEWFGTRVERYEEHGEVQEYPSQLNLGFYPGGRAYFYSNPWPFEGDQLMKHDLPHGTWTTDGFEGSVLYYDQIAGDPDAEKKLREYARAVYEAGAPTLMA